VAADRTDQDRIHPSELLEADLLEQQIPLEPPLSDDGHDFFHRVDGAAASEVDEADFWEQQLPVPLADDDYPHDRFGAG
jgi:hypothetical protein